MSVKSTHHTARPSSSPLSADLSRSAPSSPLPPIVAPIGGMAVAGPITTSSGRRAHHVKRCMAAAGCCSEVVIIPEIQDYSLTIFFNFDLAILEFKSKYSNWSFNFGV